MLVVPPTKDLRFGTHDRINTCMERANEQTQIIERDIARLREDHVGLNARFDRHLEIYAQNKQELAALKNEVSHLTSAIQSMDRSQTKNNDNQWTEIKTNTKDIGDIKIELGKVGVRVGAYAAISSAIVSGVVLTILETVL
jgi:hypothetical protein